MPPKKTEAGAAKPKTSSTGSGHSYQVSLLPNLISISYYVRTL